MPNRSISTPIGPSIAYVELNLGLYCLIDSDDVARLSSHLVNLLLGSILDRIDMAPNDDPLPHVREYVRQWIDRRRMSSDNPTNHQP